MRTAFIRIRRKVAAPALPPVSQSEYHIFGHSLAVYTGGDLAPASDYTSVGEWIGLLAQNSGAEAFGTFTFAQFSDANAEPWPNPNINGSFDIGNNFDPSPTGTFSQRNYHHFYMMASNFLAVDMGPYPFDNSIATAQSEMETLIDNIQSVYPSAESFLYIHSHDAGDNVRYPGMENMARPAFTTYNTDVQNEYLNWHTGLQDAVHATRPIRSIPVGPTIAWLCENESYLTSLDFSDLYGDSAPHGSENIYFLAALVCYRVVFRQNPVVSDFVFPAAATQMLSAITDNVQSIVNAIESRLTFHNNNGVNVY